MMSHEIGTRSFNQSRDGNEKDIVKIVNNFIDSLPAIATRISKFLDFGTDADIAYPTGTSSPAWLLLSATRGCFDYSIGLLNNGQIVDLSRFSYPEYKGPYGYVQATKLEHVNAIESEIYVKDRITLEELFQALMVMAKKFGVPAHEVGKWENRFEITDALVGQFVSEF